MRHRSAGVEGRSTGCGGQAVRSTGCGGRQERYISAWSARGMNRMRVLADKQFSSSERNRLLELRRIDEVELVDGLNAISRCGCCSRFSRKITMDPAEMIVPVFGIAAAAAVTFYTVSFMQMSDKSFEDLEERDYTDSTVLRSSQSNKDKRKIRKELKQQQSK